MFCSLPRQSPVRVFIDANYSLTGQNASAGPINGIPVEDDDAVRETTRLLLVPFLNDPTLKPDFCLGDRRIHLGPGHTIRIGSVTHTPTQAWRFPWLRNGRSSTSRPSPFRAHDR